MPSLLARATGVYFGSHVCARACERGVCTLGVVRISRGVINLLALHSD